MTRARVTLRIDGGYESAATTIAPILAARNMVGSLHATTSRLNTPGWVTSAQLASLAAAGWEVASHGRSNTVDLLALTPAEQWDELAGSKQDLEALGHTVRAFSPQSNRWDAALAAMAADAGYTSASVGYGNPPHHLTYPLGDVFNLKRSPSINSQAHSAAEVTAWIDAVVAAGGWLILLFHHVRDTSDSLSTSVAMFTAIVDHLQACGVEVVTQDAGLTPPDPGDPVAPQAAELGQVVMRGPSGNHVLTRARLGELNSELDVSAFRSPFGVRAHMAGTGHEHPPIVTIRGVIERDSLDDAADALEALAADLPHVDQLSIGTWLVPVRGAVGSVIRTPTLRGWALTASLQLDPETVWEDA